ncbi:transposase [Nonomuraea zeae]|uniref:transposase n=1 Tax=Nonomuraea zeae TaxID=1642303 RepID=UPI003608B59B
MTRRRRQFSPEFKDEAVRMVLEGDRTVASVARSAIALSQQTPVRPTERRMSRPVRKRPNSSLV